MVQFPPTADPAGQRGARPLLGQFAQSPPPLPSESSTNTPRETIPNSSSKGLSKKWAPKVRTGCLTCRARRIKCDEGKPACHRCAVGRRSCVYEQLASKSVRDIGASPGRLTFVRPGTHPNPSETKATAQDLEAFYMFRLDTAPRVCGLFDQTFWNADIPRASQVYPAIWHANLALACVQRWKGSKVAGEVTTAAATRQLVLSTAHYNAAIQYLVEIAGKQEISLADREVILMCEVVFVGVNSLLGDGKQATKHAYNALNLFSRWKYWKEEESALTVMNKQSVVILISNLETQFMHRLCHISLPAWRDWEHPLPVSDKPFTCIDDAYFEWMPIWTGVVVTSRGAEGAAVGKMRPLPDVFFFYRKEIVAWAKKFDEFQRTVVLTDENNIFASRILSLYITLTRASLDFDIADGIFITDSFAPAFRAGLDTLEEMLANRTSPHPSPSANNSTFSFSFSICEVCCWICTNCRDHDFRKRVVSLLRSHQICDSLWDSRLIASLLETHAEVEDEGGLDNLNPTLTDKCPCIYKQFICGQHRLLDSWVEFVRDGEAIMHYLAVKDADQPAKQRLFVY